MTGSNMHKSERKPDGTSGRRRSGQAINTNETAQGNTSDPHRKPRRGRRTKRNGSTAEQDRSPQAVREESIQAVALDKPQEIEDSSVWSSPRGGKRTFMTGKWHFLFAALIFFGFIFCLLSDDGPDSELIETGKLYATQCRPLEINIDRGRFRAAHNRLQCGDTIVHVDKNEYKEAIQAWQAYNARKTTRGQR